MRLCNQSCIDIISLDKIYDALWPVNTAKTDEEVIIGGELLGGANTRTHLRVAESVPSGLTESILNSPILANSIIRPF